MSAAARGGSPNRARLNASSVPTARCSSFSYRARARTRLAMVARSRGSASRKAKGSSSSSDTLPLRLDQRARCCVAGVHHAAPLEKQDAARLRGEWLVLHTARHDDHLARGEFHLPVAEVHAEAALQHEEHLVLLRL